MRCAVSVNSNQEYTGYWRTTVQLVSIKPEQPRQTTVLHFGVSIGLDLDQDLE